MVIGSLVLLIVALFSCNVMWKSPNFYTVQQPTELKESIMDMDEYSQIIQIHRRPYCFTVSSSFGGKVYILGIEHTKDENHPQLDTIRNIWNEANPDAALVEGRLGFYFQGFRIQLKNMVKED